MTQYNIKDNKPASVTKHEQSYVPDIMQALHLPPGPYDERNNPAKPETLEYDTAYPVPTPSPDEYLIKVQTATACVGEIYFQACRSGDKAQRDGFKPHGPIPGHEFCGKVISTPTADERKPSGPKFKIADEVFGFLSYERDFLGTAADYTLATEVALAYKPTNISTAEATTMPLASLIAWQALFDYAGLDPDDGASNRPAGRPLRVLVTNASDSAIAMQAIQLLHVGSLFPKHTSRMMGGGEKHEPAVWICATGNVDSLDFVRNTLGTDAVTAATDVAAAFREHGWDPVDIVLEVMGGGATVRQVHSPVVVKDTGYVLTICRPVSAHPDRPAAKDVRGEIISRGLNTELVVVKPNGGQLGRIAKLVERGELKPLKRYEVVDLLCGRQALIRADQENGASGKVVLRVDPAID